MLVWNLEESVTAATGLHLSAIRQGMALPIYSNCAGIFKQSLGARNQVGLGLSYWPARLHRLAELIPWNQFLAP
jgi:hypothetical protein